MTCLSLEAGATISLYRGQDLTLLLSVKDPAGAAITLAGAVVYFTVATIPEGIPVITKTSNAVLEIKVLAPATAGQAEIYLLPADTSGLDSAIYAYDAWVQVASGKRYPVVPPGQFIVGPRVTVL